MKSLMIIVLTLSSLGAFANCNEEELKSASSTKIIELSCPGEQQFKYRRVIVAKISETFYCIDRLISKRSLSRDEIYRQYEEQRTETECQRERRLQRNRRSHTYQQQQQPQERQQRQPAKPAVQRQQPQQKQCQQPQQAQSPMQETMNHSVSGHYSAETLKELLSQLPEYIGNCTIETIINGPKVQRQQPQIPHRY
jgi:hypothetical protein